MVDGRKLADEIASEIETEINRVYDEVEPWADADVKLRQFYESQMAELWTLRHNIDRAIEYAEKQARENDGSLDGIKIGKWVAYADMESVLYRARFGDCV